MTPKNCNKQILVANELGTDWQVDQSLIGQQGEGAKELSTVQAQSTILKQYRNRDISSGRGTKREHKGINKSIPPIRHFSLFLHNFISLEELLCNNYSNKL